MDDIIKTDTGDSGMVLDIGLRSTKIRNWDGELLIIPNKKIANVVINNKKRPKLDVRVKIEFGVEYGSDPDRVKVVVERAIKKVKTLSKNHDITIWFTGFGESSLDFKAMFWVDDITQKWATHQKAITLIYAELRKEKINIPFPIRTVYMKKGK